MGGLGTIRQRNQSGIVRLLGIAAIVLLAGTGTLVNSEPLGDNTTVFDPLLLNIRLSTTRLQPPVNLIRETWVLDGYRLGRIRPQAPNSAIIEDDQHRRLLVLSAMEDHRVRIYRLADMPVKVADRLPGVIHCANEKRCSHTGMDPAGEMGCLALCLLERLR
jgi:hypothetical protein